MRSVTNAGVLEDMLKNAEVILVICYVAVKVDKTIQFFLQYIFSCVLLIGSTK